MSQHTPITGRIHSLQSLGTLDGPGIRFVVFLQGCPLRCGCCHNPDTWDPTGGTEMTAEEIFSKALHYREYFGTTGGITVSGGEPLLQATFVAELFQLCHKAGIHTCLDTSGCLWNDAIANLLSETDLVLLDIKYTTDSLYRAHVGCSLEAPLAFLSELEQRNIPTVLRQVILPTLNDSDESIAELNAIAMRHKNVQKVELLPFKKICQTKYDTLGIPFPFAELPTPSAAVMQRLTKLLH